MGEYEALLMAQETGDSVSVLSLHNVYGTPCDFGERVLGWSPIVDLRAGLSQVHQWIQRAIEQH